ncbi:hypothetical protein HERIO_1618 [Hepatospora eriocheir]|uniref:Uncharacterized protein n=1 Tax=Hepatospora eriocheir TaxID=1081669 RepID=A0A1X0Q9H8_9MICR|nr:hypothetical protein HERIO_1618 [Hepatospora eriocheir]
MTLNFYESFKDAKASDKRAQMLYVDLMGGYSLDNEEEYNLKCLVQNNLDEVIDNRINKFQGMFCCNYSKTTSNTNTEAEKEQPKRVMTRNDPIIIKIGETEEQISRLLDLEIQSMKDLEAEFDISSTDTDSNDTISSGFFPSIENLSITSTDNVNAFNKRELYGLLFTFIDNKKLQPDIKRTETFEEYKFGPLKNKMLKIKIYKLK